MIYPKYLVRSTDHSIYVLVKDDMYKSECVYLTNEYSYKTLINSNFYEITKDQIDETREKSNLYYAYLCWHNRSDVHGGIKGGSIEEYFKYKEG